MNLVKKLEDRKLIRPPSWLSDSVQLLVNTGSVAYGISKDTSDIDCYGICIPKKEQIFPHLSGEILGFGKQKQRFEHYLQHGVVDINKGVKYDITVFNIVKSFHLMMECNPNQIEIPYVPQDCILSTTQVGQMIRENRRLFLHKGAWPKHKGYAYSSLHKMTNRNIRLEYIKEIEAKYDIDINYDDLVEEEHRRGLPEYNAELGNEGVKKLQYDEIVKCRQILSSNRNQKILDEKQEFDRKFATHCVRLLLQAEQILTEYDLDLRKHSDQLKAIRRGEVSEKDVREFFSVKEKELEKVYHDSKIPYGPDEAKIKDLLLRCLEHHYGSLDRCVERLDKYEIAINKIKDIVNIL